MQTDKNATATPREKLTIDQRLNRLQSLLKTINLACLCQMDAGGDQHYYDLSNATEIASEMVDDIANELENVNAA